MSGHCLAYLDVFVVGQMNLWMVPLALRREPYLLQKFHCRLKIFCIELSNKPSIFI